MSEQASGKTKFSIGHWIALGAAAVALLLLLLQLILFFTTKPKAGAVINGLVHTGLLAVLVAAAVVALLMARRNVRLNVLVYVLAAVVFLLAPYTVARHIVVTFYLLICVLAFIVGTLVAGRVLVLPTSADVRAMKAGLGGSGAPKPAPVPVTEPAKADTEQADTEEDEPEEDEPGSVPLA